MITIIDKTYTIKYSKGGVNQFANFNYSKGKLISYNFRPIWVKLNEVPSLDGLEKIEDVLDVIKKWSYCNQAEIILIDGDLPNYKSKEITNEYAEEFDKFFRNLSTNFFKSEILPILTLGNDLKISS
jgi:hypothetical protein